MARMTKRWLLVALGLAIAASAFAPPLAGAPSGGTSPTKAVSITLYGNATTPGNGWGYGPNNITQPGPSITVNQGDVITFTLFAKDSVAHTLVIDLNGNGLQDTGEPASNPFSSPTTAVTFAYTANTAGALQYICGIHTGSLMRGSLTVRASGGGTTPAADNTVLIIGGVIIVVAIVAVAAAIMMRRKKPQA